MGSALRIIQRPPVGQLACVGLSIALLLALSLMAGCASGAQNLDQEMLAGRALLWHAWPEEEAQVLEETVARFQALHPEARIKVRAFGSEEEMLDAFKLAADSGLGPDALLTTSRVVRPLIDAGLIADVSDDLTEEEWSRYAPKAVDALRANGGVYGIPESQNAMVLYYNRDLVDRPPATLDDLMLAAEQGREVLISADFLDSFWGVQAFGGALFDEENRVILNQGGFVNWLAWLVGARDLPDVILDPNRAALRDRFTRGRADYYVGDSSEYAQIAQAMGGNGTGEGKVGVAPLPSGPLGPAGPFLTVRAFLFSTVSSESSHRLSLALARFITNAEQSATMMRELYHTPANIQVNVNPRLNPVVGAFVQQMRSATPLQPTHTMATVLRLTADVYIQVLEGERSPVQAALETTQAINKANGFPDDMTPVTACNAVGSIRLLNVWPQPYADALEQITEAFRGECPGVIVAITHMSPADVLRMVETGPIGLGRFALIAGDQQLLADLAAREKLQRIDPLLDAQTLQRFQPRAIQAMRYESDLYGLPVFGTLDALYYNKALVENPALSLTELRAQARDGTPVQLEAGFVPGAWGIGAFGGDIWDDQVDLTAFERGLAGWLAWLAETQQTTTIQLLDDREALAAAFQASETAYLIAEPARWSGLQTQLGDDLDLAMLPAGPDGLASPLLGVSGFMLPAKTSEGNRELAMRFIEYVTESDRPELMSGPTAALPVSSVTVELPDKPLSVYAEQARTAIPVPTIPQWADVVRLGDRAYEAVLVQGVDPDKAARQVISDTLTLLGASAPAGEATPQPTPEATVTSQEQK